ncbi:hypothetical protein EB093_04765 [bacterium]|nr:hypothetical protein [bacterium]
MCLGLFVAVMGLSGCGKATSSSSDLGLSDADRQRILTAVGQAYQDYNGSASKSNAGTSALGRGQTMTAASNENSWVTDKSTSLGTTMNVGFDGVTQRIFSGTRFELHNAVTPDMKATIFYWNCVVSTGNPELRDNFQTCTWPSYTTSARLFVTEYSSNNFSASVNGTISYKSGTELIITNGSFGRSDNTPDGWVNYPFLISISIDGARRRLTGAFVSSDVSTSTSATLYSENGERIGRVTIASNGELTTSLE